MATYGLGGKRNKYKRPINPAFQVGVDVGFHGGGSSDNYIRTKVLKVLGSGHILVQPYKHLPDREPIKFRIDGGNTAFEVGKDNSRYQARCYLWDDEFQKNRDISLEHRRDQQRRNKLSEDLKIIPVHALTAEQMTEIESVIQKYKSTPTR